MAEPPVAIVDEVVDKKGTREVAKAYLEYLIHGKRARNCCTKLTTVHVMKKLQKNMLTQFPEIELFTIDEVFGGWKKAQETHFSDGGVFDSIYAQ